jgi:predicted ATPase
MKILPETKKAHPKIIVDNLLSYLETCKNLNRSIVIITYAEYVFEEIRTFVLNNQFTDCFNVYVLKDNENKIKNLRMDKLGNIEWIHDVFEQWDISIEKFIDARSEASKREKED